MPSDYSDYGTNNGLIFLYALKLIQRAEKGGGKKLGFAQAIQQARKEWPKIVKELETAADPFFYVTEKGGE